MKTRGPVHHIHRQPGRVRRLRSRGLVRLVSAMTVGGARVGVSRFSKEGRIFRIPRILGILGIPKTGSVEFLKMGEMSRQFFL